MVRVLLVEFKYQSMEIIRRECATLARVPVVNEEVHGERYEWVVTAVHLLATPMGVSGEICAVLIGSPSERKSTFLTLVEDSLSAPAHVIVRAGTPQKA